jgi:hypothetical protein
MPTSVTSDFKLIDPIMQAGYTETLDQQTDVFNGASAGAIVMEAPAAKAGVYERNAFFQALTNGAVSRRDNTSTAAVAAAKLTQSEIVRVKLSRKVGPIETSLDALRKIGSSVEGISYVIGQQVAKAHIQEALNSAITALAAALQNQGATAVFDGSAATLNHAGLVTGNALFGDRAQEIACYVMHSKAYFDLTKQAIGDKVTEVAGAIINGAATATLGKPTIITDSPALIVGTGPNKYLTLGLVPGAVSLQMTEAMEMVNQLITGQEVLLQRFQGEYAFNLGLKGFTWDVANGGDNPAAAALGTGTNWDKVFTSLKDCAGVGIKTL